MGTLATLTSALFPTLTSADLIPADCEQRLTAGQNSSIGYGAPRCAHSAGWSPVSTFSPDRYPPFLRKRTEFTGLSTRGMAVPGARSVIGPVLLVAEAQK